MAVTYSFSSGNLIESAEVNQNFTDCAVIADAETITGAWTFTTTAANTNLILDAAVGDYDAGLFFRLETADKWAIYCNDGDSDKLVIYDDANNASMMEFALGGATLLLITLLGNLEGDDEDDWLRSMSIYQLHRLQNEISFYRNPNYHKA